MQGMTATDDGFLSTPSARRATITRMPNSSGGLISIHALREEGDLRRIYLMRSNDPFLSTPSARRATSSPIKFHAHRGFLSTPSARRAT